MAMSPAPTSAGGVGPRHCSPPPSLDFSYQEEVESSGSELEEVVTLRPPRSKSGDR